MPDLLEDLNEFRPTNTSDLLPVGTADHVSAAVIHDRRLHWIRIGALGSAAVMLLTVGVVRMTSLPSTVAGPAGSPAGGSGAPFVTPAPTVGAAKVVTTKQTVKASVAAAPLTVRRFGTGTLLQKEDGSTRLCVISRYVDNLGIHQELCQEMNVAGVSWDQIPWRQSKLGSMLAADVDFIGTIDTLRSPTTVTLDTVAPAGTLVVVSDAQGATGYPAMTCVRTSDPGTGGSVQDPVSVPGYQGAWLEGGTMNVAATGNLAAVETAVRIQGYGGPLCVGTLTTPTQQEINDATAGRGPDGLLASEVQYNGGAHIAYQVLANVPGLKETLQVEVDKNLTGIGVDVIPALLAVT